MSGLAAGCIPIYYTRNTFLSIAKKSRFLLFFLAGLHNTRPRSRCVRPDAADIAYLSLKLKYAPLPLQTSDRISYVQVVWIYTREYRDCSEALLFDLFVLDFDGFAVHVDTFTFVGFRWVEFSQVGRKQIYLLLVAALDNQRCWRGGLNRYALGNRQPLQNRGSHLDAHKLAIVFQLSSVTCPDKFQDCHMSLVDADNVIVQGAPYRAPHRFLSLVHAVHNGDGQLRSLTVVFHVHKVWDIHRELTPGTRNREYL